MGKQESGTEIGKDEYGTQEIRKDETIDQAFGIVF